MNEAFLTPGTYFVDARFESSATASIRFLTPAPNYGCATPIDAAFCTPIHPEGTGAVFSWDGCDPPDDGRIDRFISYRVNMPADSILHLLGADVLSDHCGGPRRVFAREAFLGPYAAGPAVIGIAHWDAAIYFEALPVAPNRNCATPAWLAPNETLTQNTGTTGGNGDVHAAACGVPSTLYYVISLPPRTSARVVPSGVVRMSVASSCDAFAFFPDDGPAVATNDTDVTSQRLVQVSSASGSGGSAFTLSATLLARSDAATNSFCDTPTDLVSGVTASAQDLTRAYSQCFECGGHEATGALYYRVRIPAHRAGHVAFSRPLVAEGALRCGDRPDGGSPSLPTDASGIPISNDGDVERDVEFAVFGSSDATATTFDVTWTEGE